MSGKDWSRLLLLSLLWGGSFFFVGVAVPVLPPFTIVLARVGLAALVLGATLVLLRRPLPKGGRLWAALIVMGVLNNLIPFSLFALAQGQIGSGLASILNATTPLWGVIVAHLATTDERMTPARVIGVLVGFAGVAVMMGGSAFRESGGHLWGQLACLGAAISYAIAGVWGRRFRATGLPPLSVAFGQCLSAAVLLAPVVALREAPWTLPMPAPHVLWALVGLAVLSTSFAYALYFGLIQSAGAVNAFLVTFLIPVSAVALGVAFLGETLLPRQVAGMGLIALGLSVIDGRVWRRITGPDSGARPRA